jgi:ribosome-binding factor A
MLAGKRAVRVGDQLLREIADLLLKKARDPRVKGATLTGIRLSDDLKYGKVYYSVMGDQEEVRKTQAGFDRAKGFIKREIGIRMDLKYVPDIHFVHDPSLEKGERMERLLKTMKTGVGPEGTE